MHARVRTSIRVCVRACVRAQIMQEMNQSLDRASSVPCMLARATHSVLENTFAPLLSLSGHHEEHLARNYLGSFSAKNAGTRSAMLTD